MIEMKIEELKFEKLNQKETLPTNVWSIAIMEIVAGNFTKGAFYLYHISKLFDTVYKYVMSLDLTLNVLFY